MVGFPGGSAVKSLPAMWGTQQGPWVRSLGQEDPLKKEMATHSSIPAWKIPWTEETGRPIGFFSEPNGLTKESDTT